MIRSTLLIGLGQIGMGYDFQLDPKEFILTHARACEANSNFKLVGGVDTSLENREKFKKKFNCDAFESLDLALKNLRPELVIIATPTATHLNILKEIYSVYSPEAILCEKPLAYELEDAKEIVSICEKHKTKLFVNYHRRSDSGVHKIKSMLDELPSSELIKGVCWYSKGIYNNGSHFLNLLCYWLGKLDDATIIQKGRLWQGVDPEPDVHFLFQKGSVVFLSAREENFSHYTVELVTSQGRLRYDMGGKKIIWQPKMNQPNNSGYTYLNNETQEIENTMNFAQSSVLNQVYLSLENQPASVCGGEEGLEILVNLEKLRAKL